MGVRIAPVYAIVVLLIVLASLEPYYNGLVICFIVGLIISSKEIEIINWHDKISSKLGVMNIPLKLLMFVAGIAVAYSIRMPSQELATLINLGFKWYVYIVSSLRYLAILPVSIFILLFIKNIDEHNILKSHVVERISLYVWPFILSNFLIFGIVGKLLVILKLSNFKYFSNIDFPIYSLYIVCLIFSIFHSVIIRSLFRLIMKTPIILIKYRKVLIKESHE